MTLKELKANTGT